MYRAQFTETALTSRVEGTGGGQAGPPLLLNRKNRKGDRKTIMDDLPTSNASGERLLKAAEVGAILGIGRTKAYEYLALGILPKVQLGRSVRVPRTALLAWIQARTQGGQTDDTADPPALDWPHSPRLLRD
jgi:excisionase family DNA binding protein